MNIILTGSTGGIGSAISRHLEKKGHCILSVQSRLEEMVILEKEIKGILESIEVHALVNCAGFGIFQPHEEIAPEKIRRMIDVNLAAPIILAGLCLRSLKKNKGHIINISSIEATRHSKFSALYTATKSGLRDFSLALFEEVRKSGVRVSSINPDMTNTAFFDALTFRPSDDSSCHLCPEDIARAVDTVLQSDGVITDLTIRPQKSGVIKKASGKGKQ